MSNLETIELGENVRVSDPCYDDDVWCKTKLEGVLPGKYKVDVNFSDEGAWGTRVSKLTVIHQDYVNTPLGWEDYDTIGVDSGQAGIFCESSYRKDSIAADIETENVNFNLGDYRKEDAGGDEWYEKMCRLTLSKNSWGAYPTGVVTSSGFGDGSYPLDVARNDDDKIVGITITYIEPEDEWEDEEDEGDVCPVCGETNADGESCNCQE
jgi:hypothetical protein